ncbi:(S)-1-Phenylethanol dehydrogenase [Methylobacterium gregans]|uniref:(S)-1-Phenylethanol dehydrogenase n=1 Tax=Methylobacterium gregans TaxID=374424 RepID=A0AA37MD76_9HYPH|nr:NAD(P)-dependent dehydrogenase (short-subunit alcohol dehydrogenase family) [Methylobacterium gregans]GJD80613.1 (S)-1-Phenylethanol dehydrogenase [Methylobacterium gregans]
MLLRDKVCVITGAASARGIGKATARRFAAHGACIVILDLNAGQAEAAAREIGPGHLGLACDVTDRAACQIAAGEIVAQVGRIDVLVNNAGITQPLKLMQIEAANYDAVTDVNPHHD